MKYLKRFSIFEAIKPSDLIQSGELFQQLKNYNQWEELLYPVTVDYIQAVNQKDVELTYELVQDFLSVYDKRQIAKIVKAKRYFQDEIESCVSIHLKGDKCWSTDDHFIFYKFEDEWWAVEIHLLGSYRRYICDGIEGLKAMWQHMKDWWTSPTKKQNESHSNQIFRKIEPPEYDTKVWGDTEEGSDEETEWIIEKWEKFDKEEILKICKILYPNLDVSEYLNVFPYLPEMVEDAYYGDPEAGGCQIKFYPESVLKDKENFNQYPYIQITKLRDEWFYVYYKPTGQRYTEDQVLLFECDQWHGLIDFLKWFIVQIKFD